MPWVRLRVGKRGAQTHPFWVSNRVLHMIESDDRTPESILTKWEHIESAYEKSLHTRNARAHRAAGADPAPRLGV